jgi:hypothetical protein
MKIFTINDITYVLGQNSQDNHNMIDMIKKDNNQYWWFHLRNFPSGHCIVKSTTINNNIIYTAGLLVKDHSKYINYKNIKVDYIQLKYIKKTHKIGEVILLKKPSLIII